MDVWHIDFNSLLATQALNPKNLEPQTNEAVSLGKESGA